MRTLSPLPSRELVTRSGALGGSGEAGKRRGGQASWRASVVAGKRRGGQAYYEPQELRMTQYLMPEGDSPQPTTSTSWSMSFAVLGVLLGSMYTPSFSAMLELNE
jgi:hypothetical protein